jgi:hypothetical protein
MRNTVSGILSGESDGFGAADERRAAPSATIGTGAT